MRRFLLVVASVLLPLVLPAQSVVFEQPDADAPFALFGPLDLTNNWLGVLMGPSLKATLTQPIAGFGFYVQNLSSASAEDHGTLQFEIWDRDLAQVPNLQGRIAVGQTTYTVLGGGAQWVDVWFDEPVALPASPAMQFWVHQLDGTGLLEWRSASSDAYNPQLNAVQRPADRWANTSIESQSSAASPSFRVFAVAEPSGVLLVAAAVPLGLLAGYRRRRA